MVVCAWLRQYTGSTPQSSHRPPQTHAESHRTGGPTRAVISVWPADSGWQCCPARIYQERYKYLQYFYVKKTQNKTIKKSKTKTKLSCKIKTALKIQNGDKRHIDIHGHVVYKHEHILLVLTESDLASSLDMLSTKRHTSQK